ncbi:MORN repeat-containing protein 5-like [Ostrinia furnacalis]|uniref:MORN repeat-containing protein 5-like n=1 Tax=Ostrinia furnacalis TaxID=93504 RepID=UPI00103BFBF0|nr:MORN repeat-containing protein 5-like [Ostrinia furnacalis]
MSKSQGSSVVSEKRVSQWEDLMRKFSEAHREECKSVSVDIPRVPRSVKQFPTGSQYEGTWDVLGMSGYGTYIFPNDVIYEGEFYDGMFHGNGELRYPCGAILRGKWKRGLLTERTLMFADGLEYSDDDWKYCRMPDRKFTIEYEEGLQPSGLSYLTADQPTREIPPGYYDTGDGFYDPKTKVVYKATDLSAIIRSPSIREQKWIIENCRTAPEKELGPRQDLYEEWLEPQVEPQPPPAPSVVTRMPVTVRASRGRFESEVDAMDEDMIRERSRPKRWSSMLSMRFNKRPFIYYETSASKIDQE